MEILAQNIWSNEEIAGIKIGQNEYKISQYADDSFLMLEKIEFIMNAINFIKKFSSATGIKLNMENVKVYG